MTLQKIILLLLTLKHFFNTEEILKNFVVVFDCSLIYPSIQFFVWILFVEVWVEKKNL